MTDDADDYHECAAVLETLADVVAADVTETDIRTGTPTIEVVVEADHVPPAVLRTIGGDGLGIRDVSQRGDPTHTVALVV